MAYHFYHKKITKLAFPRSVNRPFPDAMTSKKSLVLSCRDYRIGAKTPYERISIVSIA